MSKLMNAYLKTAFLCFVVFISHLAYAQEMYKVVPLNNLQDGDRMILSVKGTEGFMYPLTNGELRFGKEGTVLPYGESSVWWTVERNGSYLRFKNLATGTYLAVEENWVGTYGTLKHDASEKDWELVAIPGVVGGFSLRNKERGHTGLIWETKYYDIIPAVPSNGALFGLTNSTDTSHTNRTPFVGIILLPNSPNRFQHYVGHNATSLDARGLQKVHEFHQDVYLAPNEQIRLVSPNYRSFYHYARWFDYGNERGDNTDGQLVYPELIFDQIPSTVEMEEYTIGGTVIFSRQEPPENSYLTYPLYTMQGEQARQVALDQSLYMDYERGTTNVDGVEYSTLKEPTLSQRMVFNIRPAKEMADRLAVCVGNDNYLEEYNLIAPVGRTIYIGPKYEFNGGKFPNYYVLHNGTLVNLKSGTWRWYRDGSQQAMDIANNRFVKVVSNTSTTVTYTLRCTYSGTTYNVARFVVQFVPATQVGPYEKLGEGQLEGLDLLTEEHFNFNQPGSSVVSYYNHPFMVEESTYGFHYHDLQEAGLRADKASTTWGVAKGPYWSEYAFINSTATAELDFLHPIANRNGVSTGYFLYVDGSETPGNVFRLSIPATLCPGGTMYFSAYVASLNNGSSAAAPNLDFIVLGYDTDGNEHVLTTYTTGEFGNGSAGSGNEAGKWLHVLFPVTIEGGIEYTNFALRITNKGKNSTGNDFAIDDIEIYASKPALMVSQASIGIDECYETEGDDIWTFLRVDYLAAQLGGTNLYYQWTNANDFTVLPMEYYGETNDSNHGAITLPHKDQDFSGGAYPTFDNITAFDAFVKQSNQNNAIAYIKEKNAEGVNQYMLYIATKGYLSPGYLYTAYISTDPNNLQTATCGWSSDLRIVGKAYVEMNDGIILPADPYKVEGNRIHYLKVKMQTTEGGLQVYTPKAAWLWGDEALVNQNQSIYGGTYDEVCAAIQAVINNDPGKTQEQEDMVDRLVNVEHLLTLNMDSLGVYVMANDINRRLAYTAFPMKNTLSQGVRVCLDPLVVILVPAALAPVTRVGYTVPGGLQLPNLVSASPRVVRVNPSKRKEGKIDIPFVYDGDGGDCSVEVRPLDAEATGITANFNMEPLSTKMVLLQGIGNLKAGKDYLFEVASTLQDMTKQYSYFTLRILPDEVRWNSTRLPGDQWNKDAYWEPAFVPTSDMNVILPPGEYTIPLPVSEDKQKMKLEDGAQPYITYDIYYEPYSCRNIYVPGNTTVLNQDLLQVSGQAYIDITVPTNTWTLISIPISGVVSGDFWIPSEGNSTGAFDIRTINQVTGERAIDRLNNQVWQSIYNGESIVYGDYNRVVTSSEWSAPTNALNAPYKLGSGLALWAMSDNATQTFRMPKRDEEYKFYYDYSEKWTDNQKVTIDRKGSGKLAYSSVSSTYHLENNTSSKTFLFGNPTLAYIDLKKFASANGLTGVFTELLPSASTILELNQTVDGLSNTGKVLDYLPPHRAVLLEAYTEGTDLEVEVTPDMLSHAPNGVQPMSVRRMSSDDGESLMYISASTADYVSRALVAERSSASDWVMKGEDAELLLLDGYKTPFGIYTLCEDKSLVINQINGAEELPLCLYVQEESPLVDNVELNFSGSADFISQWQLFDAVTEMSVDLYDGCSLSAEMPSNGRIRYFLMRKQDEEGGSSPSTGLFQVWSVDGQLTVSAPDGLDRLSLTDMAGRVILEKENTESLLQISLQPGVYMIYGSLGKIVYTKPIIVR